MPTYTNSGDALNGLQKFQQGMQTPQQILQGAQDTSGASQAQQQVSGLQQAIQNTTGLLNKVAPDVLGRTQNSLVTQAQADRITANEQAPLQSQLTDQTQSEQTEAQQLAADQQNAQDIANAQITGQQGTLSNYQQIYSDLLGKEQAAQAAQQAADQQAEAKREFDAQQALAQQQLAAQQAAAKASSGSGIVGAGPGPAKAAAAPTNYNSQPVASWINYIHSNYHGQSWGAIAAAIQKSTGTTIPTGSNLDQALHYIFTGSY